MHACTYACTHVCVYLYILVYIHTRVTHTCKYICTYTHPYIQVHIRMMHIRIHTRVHICSHIYVNLGRGRERYIHNEIMASFGCLRVESHELSDCHFFTMLRSWTRLCVSCRIAQVVISSPPRDHNAAQADRHTDRYTDTCIQAGRKRDRLTDTHTHTHTHMQTTIHADGRTDVHRHFCSRPFKHPFYF